MPTCGITAALYLYVVVDSCKSSALVLLLYLYICITRYPHPRSHRQAFAVHAANLVPTAPGFSSSRWSQSSPQCFIHCILSSTNGGVQCLIPSSSGAAMDIMYTTRYVPRFHGSGKCKRGQTYSSRAAFVSPLREPGYPTLAVHLR